MLETSFRFLLTAGLLSLATNSFAGAIITEVMHRPDSGFAEEEWIEVHNTGLNSVDLLDFSIKDESGSFGAFNFAYNPSDPSNPVTELEGGKTAIFYNSLLDNLTIDGFYSNWYDTNGAMLVAVDDWRQMNTGMLSGAHKTLSLIHNSDSAQNNHLGNYQAGSFPLFGGSEKAESIFLTDIGLDNTDGSNWDRAGVGAAADPSEVDNQGTPGYVPTTAAVPEPTSIALFGIAAMCVTATRRRRADRT